MQKKQPLYYIITISEKQNIVEFDTSVINWGYNITPCNLISTP